MTENQSDDTIISENLKVINNNIQEACAKAGRDPKEVTLMGVIKTIDAPAINAGIKAGLSCIGENRVQDILQKKQFLNLDNVHTNFIGTLQSNKVNQIVGQVDMIQSVDSLRLAKRISNRSQKLGIISDVLIQVNIGKEESKSGVYEDDLIEVLEQVSLLKGVKVCGIMSIPPIFDTKNEKRAIFSQLFNLLVDIRDKNIDNIAMDVLSMGMSGDYQEAILEGSTMVRIGTAIFGTRA